MGQFDDAIDSVADRTDSASRAVVSDVSPDDAARAFELSSATGVPAHAIASNQEDFEKFHKQSMAQSIIANNPYLQDFVNKHPLHGPLISDDLGNLDRLSKTYQTLVNDPVKAAWKGFKEGFGDEGIGAQYPEYLNTKSNLAIAALAPLGLPIELVGRLASGGLRAFYEGTTALTGNEKLARELAAMVEFEMIKPEIRTGVKEFGRRLAEAPVTEDIPSQPMVPQDEVDLGRRRFLQGAGAAAALMALPKGIVGQGLKALAPELHPLAERIAEDSLVSSARAMWRTREDALTSMQNWVQTFKEKAARQTPEELVAMQANAKEQFDVGLITEEEMKRKSDPLDMVKAYSDAAKLLQSDWMPSAEFMANTGKWIQGEQAFRARMAIQDLRPWAEAGEEPPSGISEIADKGKEEVAKLDQDTIKQALDDANSTALKERSPDKFAEFIDGHLDGTIAIEKEAIAKNPEAFKWIPNLEEELARPLSKIEVSAKDFLLNFDKELWPEVKDFISRGGPTVNEAKEVVGYHGSSREFADVDLEMGSSRGESPHDKGAIYFFKNSDLARGYGENIIQKAINLEQSKEFDATALVEDPQFLEEMKQAHYEVATRNDYLKQRAQTPEGAKVIERSWQHQLEKIQDPVWRNDTGQVRASPSLSGAILKRARAQGLDVAVIKNMAEGYGPAQDQIVVLNRNAFLEKLKPEERETLVRQVLQRGRSGRPTKTAPLGDTDRLIDRIRKAAGLDSNIPPERIQAAAIKLKDGRVFTGPNHASIMQDIQDAFKRSDIMDEIEGTDFGMGGFITSYGRHVDRKEAEAIAAPQGQARRVGGAMGLTSENLDLEGQPEDLEPTGGGLPPSEPPIPPSGEPPKPEESKPSGIFTDAKAFGRTKPEYAKYLELIAQRDAEDVAYRTRRAERQAERENSRAWKEARAELEPEVRDEVTSRPEIAAWNFFEKGEAFGQKLSRRPKLDRAALTEDQFAALPASWIRDGGLHPDAVASTFGYTTGADLVDALASTAREAEGQKGSIVDRLVNAELDRRLNDKLGEDAAERLEEAKDHALSLTTMEMLHEQVLALGTRLGVELPLDKGRMDWGSREVLKEQKFGGLTSTKLLSEAAKAARLLEKSLLSDDPQEAFKQAQYHYTVTQMAKEMLAIEKETKKFEKLAKKYRDRDAGPDTFDSKAYTNWIHDILMRVGRPVRRSIQDLQDEINAQPQKTLANFLLDKLGEGKDIPVPDFLVDPTFRKPLEQMTVQEARQAMNAVRALDFTSREEGKVEIGGEKLDRKEKLKEVNEQLKTLGPASEPTNFIWDVGRRFLAGTLQTEFLFNRFDYGNVFGLVSQWAWRPMAEAASGKARLGKQIAKALPEIPKSIDLNAAVPNTLFKDWQSGLQADGKIDWSAATPIPFTQKNLLAVMHNLGNADNLKRLAEGYGLKSQQVMDWVNTVATKDHWDYVQAFGDVFKQLKKQSDEVYRRTVGQAPEGIDIFPIDTPFGQKEGWYHPIIHDPLFEGQYKNEKADAPFAKEYQMSMPSAGYTKSRTSYRGPLDLNLDSIANRLNQEIHDISFREAVMQANKLIGDSTFRNHVTAHYGQAYTDMLKRWIKDVANGANISSENQAAWVKTSEFFRQNIIGSLVGLNPRTVQKHTITAAINSMTEVGPINFLEEFRKIALNPTTRNENWRFAMEKSEELQRRMQNFQEMVAGKYETYIHPPGADFASTFNAARNWALRTGTAPVAFFDLYSAVPTWLAKYNVSKKLGMSEGDAIYAADTSVRNAHGSSAITSRPELMRQQPWLASLYGFFNHVANQQYKLAWRAKEAAGLGSKPADLSQAPSLALGLFSYVLAPAIIEELVTPYTNKENESWGKKAAKTIGLGLSSSWIGVRDVARAIIDAKDPTIGLLGTEYKAFTDLIRDLSKGEVAFDKAHAGKTIKHSFTAFGAATGLTNSAEGNLAEYLWNLHTGQEKPPKDMKELWRGVSKGTSTPPSGPDLIERALPGKPRRQ